MGRPKNSKNKIDLGVYLICKYCHETYRVMPYRKNISNFCSIRCRSSQYYDSTLAKAKHGPIWNKNIKTGLVPRSAFKKGQSPWNKGVAMSPEYKRNYLKAINTPECKEKHRTHRLHQIFPLKDSSIEVKLQKILEQAHIPFTKHHPVLGQPDIFIAPNICIFADGDYWHTLPNAPQRDQRVTAYLQSNGYTVLRFWEHDINQNIDKVLQTIIGTIPTLTKVSK